MTLKSEFEVPCPCCHATLVFDTNLRRVVRHIEPVRGDRPELSNAERILAEEAARREAIFANRSRTRRTATMRSRDDSRKRCARLTKSPLPGRYGISTSNKGDQEGADRRSGDQETLLVHEKT